MMTEIKAVPALEVVHWQPVLKQLNPEEFQLGRFNGTRLNAHYIDSHTYCSFVLSFCLHIDMNRLSSHLTMHTRSSNIIFIILFIEVVIQFTTVK